MIDHDGFKKLLLFQNAKDILFTEVQLTETEQNKLLISGESSFLSKKLKDAEFCVYQDENREEGYDFKWSGTIDKISMQELFKSGIIKDHALNTVDSLLRATFDNTKLLFTQKNQTITLEASDSDFNIDLLSAGLAVNKIGFSYESTISEPFTNKYTVTGIVSIGSSDTLVEIQIPGTSTDDLVSWSLKLPNEVLLENALEDISQFLSQNPQLKPLLGDGKLLGFFPEDIRKPKGLCVSELKVLFDPTQAAISLIDTTLNYYSDWEVIPGFKLQNIGLNILAKFHEKHVGCTLKLFGKFSFIEDAYVNFSSDLPLNKKDDWVISLEGHADFDKLDKLESLNLFKLESLNLPHEWFIMEQIRLHKLEIKFNPFLKKVKKVEVEVSLIAESTLIPWNYNQKPGTQIFN